ncbi:MAG: diguanylate cyclase [Thiohalophilus sp.]
MDCRVFTDELADLSLLQGVNQADLKWLLHHCDVVHMEKDQVLLSPDEDNETIYILMDGRLTVQFDRQRGGMWTYVDKGGWVGEMSVIDNMRPSATVMTDTKVRLLAIHASVWWELIERSHVAARNFLRAVSFRLRQDNKLIAEGMQKQLIFSEKAQTDSLTGLRNRHWLEEKLPEILGAQDAGLAPCSVVMMDIDHFKDFNDRYGHLAGDSVLQNVSTVVRDNLRENDAAVRYGGEEIILVLPETNTDNARLIAQRLGRLIRENKVETYDGGILPAVTVSIGVYTILDGDTPETVISRVDSALYQAKKTGRDRVVVWEDG